MVDFRFTCDSPKLHVGIEIEVVDDTDHMIVVIIFLFGVDNRVEVD